jgi:Sir2 family
VRVLVLTGAGVSAESGIPTFRGMDGYWRNLDPTTLATPEAFARDPQLVWDWYRERRQRIRNARPNAAHEAVARLAQRTDEFLLVTQNVDDLHTRAGIPAQRMVQIHGDIFRHPLLALRIFRKGWGRFTRTGHARAIEVNRPYLRERCQPSAVSRLPRIHAPGRGVVR